MIARLTIQRVDSSTSWQCRRAVREPIIQTLSNWILETLKP